MDDKAFLRFMSKDAVLAVSVLRCREDGDETDAIGEEVRGWRDGDEGNVLRSAQERGESAHQASAQSRDWAKRQRCDGTNL